MFLTDIFVSFLDTYMANVRAVEQRKPTTIALAHVPKHYQITKRFRGEKYAKSTIMKM